MANTLNHLVKADKICNYAEISLGCGLRCLLLCRQREFSCVFPEAVHTASVFFFFFHSSKANLSWKVTGTKGNQLKACW